MKQLIIKTENDIHSKEFLDGISQLRNTPREDGFSPTQVVFGRSVRTLLPTLTEALGTNQFVEKAREKKVLLDSKRKSKYDVKSRNLKQLMPGTEVWVQNSENLRWEDKEKVIAKLRKCTYKIQFEDGRCSYRNRRKIKVRNGNAEDYKSIPTSSHATRNRGVNSKSIPTRSNATRNKGVNSKCHTHK